ncbi:hypothetical protein BU23DRAFT_4256 [Bimuria novae-zelandiae CBS 107.79]|uniref:Uncharacterized protein n=1 Tax=Bimuria novae-zelandiae CBS 107.79 TaxID=1447943 RepID=A0A6A5VWQ6_9PLEO|nr:hypothetical protein BU23DRAFT_4256 [Bimuria novae-zelandiae CBS 107.79]
MNTMPWKRSMPWKHGPIYSPPLFHECDTTAPSSASTPSSLSSSQHSSSTPPAISTPPRTAAPPPVPPRHPARQHPASLTIHPPPHAPQRRTPSLAHRFLYRPPTVVDAAPTRLPPPTTYPCAAHHCAKILFQRYVECSGGVLCTKHRKMLWESCKRVYESWYLGVYENAVGCTPVGYVMCEGRMMHPRRIGIGMEKYG